MLVLSRRQGEVILIGNEIEVHVVAIDKRRVRLAIKAPSSVHVLRSELEVAARDEMTPAGLEDEALTGV
jgi:carbon storage regulator